MLHHYAIESVNMTIPESFIYSEINHITIYVWVIESFTVATVIYSGTQQVTVIWIIPSADSLKETDSFWNKTSEFFMTESYESVPRSCLALHTQPHSVHSLSSSNHVTCSSSSQHSAPILKRTPLTHHLALNVETDFLPALLTMVVQVASLVYLLCRFPCVYYVSLTISFVFVPETCGLLNIII